MSLKLSPGHPLLRAVIFVILVVGGLWTMRRWITDQMLFHPRRGQVTTPAAVGLGFEELRIAAEDGTTIQAWWVVSAAGSQSPVVMMFHGNAETIADRLDAYAILHGLGMHVMPVEYRGYGDSAGRPSEMGLYQDGLAALAEARRRAPRSPIVVWGRSLGGAVAVHLASVAPIDGLIVESSFTSLADMAARTSIPGARHLVPYEFQSLEKIRTITAPLLVIHGDRDTLVPFSMGEALVEAAGSEQSQLHRVVGGEHNDTPLVGGESYWQAIGSFLVGIRS